MLCDHIVIYIFFEWRSIVNVRIQFLKRKEEEREKKKRIKLEHDFTRDMKHRVSKGRVFFLHWGAS